MARLFFPLLFVFLLLSRMAHVRILWTEENLPLAAAIQMLHGGALYRDIWFDKPPWVPGVYLLWGAQTGWVLRLAGAAFVFLCCFLLYRFAREKWSEREGLLAAALLAFFLTFGIPSAIMPLAADLLLVAPHIAAVYLAWRGRPFLAGAMAGTGLLFNSKAAVVLAVCAVFVIGKRGRFAWRPLLPLAAGFSVPGILALVWMAARGSLGAYYEQVWQLGRLYAASTFVESPLREAFLRTLNWAGFHAALVIGAIAYWLRDRDPDRWKFAVWAALSLAAVAAGWRFFPRYYFQLLPVMALVGARGFFLLHGPKRLPQLLFLVALLVPAIRFGPRYLRLASDLAAGREHAWSDVAMDYDSRRAAKLVLDMAKPGDTLFVWGYRPDIYAYTRMPAASRFLESQPLSGVFADRHLFQSKPVAEDVARRRRLELRQSKPDFLLDGLAHYNPALGIERYEDLRPWLADYAPAARTEASVIYRRKP